MTETTDPMIRPGEIAGWPKLVLRYRSDLDRIADLLPPGIETIDDDTVTVNVYCVPVKGEPEYGVSTKVRASWQGTPGYYSLGLGIDQESAIFISAETNGQPKFPCTIRFFREGDRVEASCNHQGYTFLEFSGTVSGRVAPTGDEVEENEWWTKYSRAIGGVEKSYDFPPHVVRVHSRHTVVHEEAIDGTITLRDSPWDPYTELLPMHEQLGASLVTQDFSHREITNAGPLDPIAFWPHADTIGGSRWPGERGGPRPAPVSGAQTMAFDFDLLFEVQVPKPWDGGKERDRFHEAIDQAVWAEQHGFSTVWVVEHHFLSEWAHSSAPEVLLGAISQRTSTIRIGQGVALLPGAVNHPIRVAERAAMIDIVSDGRLEMGTGRSSSPYQLEAFGVDVATTREQWKESISLLPRLWTEEKMTYAGEFWSWDDAITVVPRPVQQPHPPLWVAATQTDTCQMAGEMGIGLLMPALNSPENLKPLVDTYKDGIARGGDHAGMFVTDQAALFAVTFCHDDHDYARIEGGSAALWYIDTIQEIYSNDWRGTPLEEVPPSYRAHVAARQSGSSGAGNFTASVAGADRQAVIDQFIDNAAILVGDPDRLIDQVRRYRAIGGDRLVCVMQLADLHHDDIMRSIELFGTRIIPAIRADEAAEAAEAAG